MDRQRSDQFDAIRGYASLIVLVVHLYAWFMLPITGLGKGYSIFSAFAFYAVLVFFVLSGYLITNSLLLNRKKSGSLYVPAFLSARALRILPPFVFAMFVSIGVAVVISKFHLHGHDTFRLPIDHFLVRENVQLSMPDVVSTALLSNGVVPGTNAIITNGALWSLSIEVWLYFIALLLFLAWEGRFRDKTALAALVGLTGVFLLLRSNLLIFEYGAYWFLGAAFRWLNEVPVGKWLRRLLFLAIAVPGLAICLKDPERLIPAKQWIYSVPVNLSVLIVLTGILCLIPGRVTWWQRPGQFLAPSSYTLYIIHFPILALLFSLFHQQFMHWHKMERLAFMVGVAVLILAISHFAAVVLENRKLWKNLVGRIYAKLTSSGRGC